MGRVYVLQTRSTKQTRLSHVCLLSFLSDEGGSHVVGLTSLFNKALMAYRQILIYHGIQVGLPRHRQGYEAFEGYRRKPTHHKMSAAFSMRKRNVLMRLSIHRRNVLRIPSPNIALSSNIFAPMGWGRVCEKRLARIFVLEESQHVPVFHELLARPNEMFVICHLRKC